MKNYISPRLRHSHCVALYKKARSRAWHTEFMIQDDSIAEVEGKTFTTYRLELVNLSNLQFEEVTQLAKEFKHYEKRS